MTDLSKNMKLACGIVGLPNVGKSTLFNALIGKMQAEAANYPFCTIEPNTGNIPLEDERLEVLSKIEQTQKTVPTSVTFKDIAGLIKGASKGEGLGNKFLGHILEVGAILHVLRCFHDDDVQHVNQKTDPLDDMETIKAELLFADIDFLERKIENWQKRRKDFPEQIQHAQEILQKIKKEEKISQNDIKEEFAHEFRLLSMKPVLYVLNVEEKSVSSGNDLTEKVIFHLEKTQEKFVIISAKIEEEIAKLPPQEKLEMLKEFGMNEDGLKKIAKHTYQMLNLITFFTAGKKETRAWTITDKTNAKSAAGKIHSDFEEKFIRAEVTSYQDYVNSNGLVNAKKNGLVRLEGKDYIVQDGDVMYFHHS